MGDEITAEASNRICTHMNDDHAVSVYAMAKSLLPNGVKITDAKLKEVVMDGCNIAVVTCKGDLCEMKRLMYPFRPRLKSAAEVRPRMVTIHQQVCAANPLWLVTHIDALVIIIIMALLGYATHIMGLDALSEKIAGSDGLNSVISMVFGSARGFSNAVFYSWVFGVGAHVLEAIYVVYEGGKTLKLGAKAQLLWFLVVSCVGYPVTKEYLDLQKVHARQLKNKKGS